MSNAGRSIVRREQRQWGAYDLEGPVMPGWGLMAVNYEKGPPGRSGQGTYLMRMPPGGETTAHDHDGYEDFIILEGELIDDDGTVIRAGDVVTYAPGSHHNSRTETGCTILVVEWNRTPTEGA
jgi:mannose-6-phosphate isomerase-like protein (cupin superfamily)